MMNLNEKKSILVLLIRRITSLQFTKNKTAKCNINTYKESIYTKMQHIFLFKERESHVSLNI